ncbi:MAG: hypothetical protein LHV68_05585 [Elusimicrobia bacterium]|nr:hypothetical protein [Candidatus Liberimonas magnetica]
MLSRIVFASTLELNDEIHMARLLILLHQYGGKRNRPIEGITKLAKADFLLRYPNCLQRVLSKHYSDSSYPKIQEYEKQNVENKMVRYKYGPWDSRFRRWMGLLVSKNLARVYTKGKTIYIELTNEGARVAYVLEKKSEFADYGLRSSLVATIVKKYSASALKNYIYEVFPELLSMKLGEEIKI